MYYYVKEDEELDGMYFIFYFLAKYRQIHTIQQVQAVCDNPAQIRDIFMGYPGSVRDSRVFRNSPLFPVLRENCQQYYILGYSGYPCTRRLTPHKDHGNLMGIEKTSV